MQFRNVAVVSVAATVSALALGIGGAQAASTIWDSSNIKNGSLLAEDFNASAKTALKGDKGDTGAQGTQGPEGAPGTPGTPGHTGETGPQGPQGQPGIDGIDGTDGVSGYEIRTWDYALVSGGGWADMGCSAGKVPLGGGYNWKDETVAMEKGLSVVTSMPGRMNWSTNTPDSTKPGWIIRPNKPANVNPGALTVYVICASVG